MRGDEDNQLSFKGVKRDVITRWRLLIQLDFSHRSANWQLKWTDEYKITGFEFSYRYYIFWNIIS